MKHRKPHRNREVRAPEGDLAEGLLQAYEVFLLLLLLRQSKLGFLEDGKLGLPIFVQQPRGTVG